MDLEFSMFAARHNFFRCSRPNKLWKCASTCNYAIRNRVSSEAEAAFQLDEDLLENLECRNVCTRCMRDYDSRDNWTQLPQFHLNFYSQRHFCFRNPLHQAAYEASYEKVQRHINSNVNAKAANHWTPLHLAVSSGDPQIVEFLLKKNADPKAKTAAGVTPLFFAVRRGCPHITKLLVDAGADVNEVIYDHKQNKCYTHLHYAIAAKKTEMVEMLLQCNARVDARNCCDDTPLILAASRDFSAIAQLLLNRGASISETVYPRRTALTESIKHGSDKSFYLLLQRTPNSELELRDDRGNSLLHCAVALGHTGFVHALLARSVNVNSRTLATGLTPLHYLCQDNIHCEAWYRETHYWRCHLHRYKNSKSEICENLLAHGADLEARDDAGSTPLHHAATSGWSELVHQLLEAGAEVDPVNRLPKSPLELAIAAGRKENASILLDYGADATRLYGNWKEALELPMQRVIARHWMKMREAGMRLDPKLTDQVTGMPVTKQLHKYSKKCKKEIEIMRSMSADFGGVTPYEFLKSSKCRIIGILSNTDTTAFFRHYQNCVLPELSVYNVMIRKNLAVAVVYKSVLHDAIESFEKACRYELPILVTEKVIDSLAVGDLKNLIRVQDLIKKNKEKKQKKKKLL